MSEPESAAGGGSDGDATVEGARVMDAPTTSGRERGPAGATRPLVLPELYDGTGNWREWSFHFDNVAAVNNWDDTQKLPCSHYGTCPEGVTRTTGIDGYDVRGHERRHEGAVRSRVAVNTLSSRISDVEEEGGRRLDGLRG